MTNTDQCWSISDQNYGIDTNADQSALIRIEKYWLVLHVLIFIDRSWSLLTYILDKCQKFDLALIGIDWHWSLIQHVLTFLCYGPCLIALHSLVHDFQYFVMHVCAGRIGIIYSAICSPVCKVLDTSTVVKKRNFPPWNRFRISPKWWKFKTLWDQSIPCPTSIGKNCFRP